VAAPFLCAEPAKGMGSPPEGGHPRVTTRSRAARSLPNHLPMVLRATGLDVFVPVRECGVWAVFGCPEPARRVQPAAFAADTESGRTAHDIEAIGTSRQRQTRRETGTQSHGAPFGASRATEGIVLGGPLRTRAEVPVDAGSRIDGEPLPVSTTEPHRLLGACRAAYPHALRVAITPELMTTRGAGCGLPQRLISSAIGTSTKERSRPWATATADSTHSTTSTVREETQQWATATADSNRTANANPERSRPWATATADSTPTTTSTLREETPQWATATADPKSPANVEQKGADRGLPQRLITYRKTPSNPERGDTAMGYRNG
jgi:hypothetical protein